MLEFVRRRLPPETKVLGARTDSLQCALNPAGRLLGSGTVLEVCGHPESQQIGLLLATLPEATASVYHIKPQHDDGSSESGSEDEEDDDDDGGVDDPDDEVDRERDAEEHRQSQQVAVAGNVEMGVSSSTIGQASITSESSVVASRSEPINPEPEVGSWLSSLLPSQGEGSDAHEDANANGESQTVPSASKANTPEDEMTSLFTLDPPPEVIVVHLAMRGAIVERLQSAYPKAAIIGGVVMGQEVLIRSKEKASAGRGVGVLAIQGNAPLFAMTCPYTGMPATTVADARRKMRLAQERAVAEEKRILGALLFTCDGPIVEALCRLVGQDANDARLFQAEFPTAPLLGHYAGGEVGPEVTENEQTAFLRGNACLQGFTAVFGIFLVPRKQVPSRQFVRAVLHGQVQEAFQELCGS